MTLLSKVAALHIAVRQDLVTHLYFGVRELVSCFFMILTLSYIQELELWPISPCFRPTAEQHNDLSMLWTFSCAFMQLHSLLLHAFIVQATFLWLFGTTPHILAFLALHVLTYSLEYAPQPSAACREMHSGAPCPNRTYKNSKTEGQ